MVNLKGLLKSIARSVLPKSVVIAFCATLVAVALTLLRNDGKLKFEMDGKNYTVYSSALAFLLVFRNGKSYSRWWDGVVAMTHLKTDFIDACAQLCSATIMSKQPKEKIDNYCYLITRLFSVFSCIAFKHIADMHDERFEVLSIEDLDEKTRTMLLTSPERPRHMMPLIEQWILNTVYRGIDESIVCAPPPLVSRFFASLHDGRVLVKKCQVISFTDFPLPYSIMINALLVIHWFYTAAFASVSQTEYSMVCSMVFCAVFAYWCINLISVELERPFGDDVNDINLHAEQREINQHLALLLDPRARHSPQCLGVTSTTDWTWSTEIMYDGHVTTSPGRQKKKGGRSSVAEYSMNKQISIDIGNVPIDIGNAQSQPPPFPPSGVPETLHPPALTLDGVMPVKLVDDSLFRELATQQQQLTASILEQLKQEGQTREILIQSQERHSQLIASVAESCRELQQFARSVPMLNGAGSVGMQNGTGTPVGTSWYGCPGPQNGGGLVKMTQTRGRETGTAAPVRRTQVSRP